MDERSNFHVITGGPGSGKTTIVEALRAVGYRAVEEAGRQVLREQEAIGGRGHHLADQVLFRELMLSRMIRDFEAADSETGPVFFDRGIPGLIGYCRLIGEPVADHIRRAADLFRYNRRIFVTPPWPEIYRADAERRQDFDEAVRTYELIAEGCVAAGYDLVEIPRAPLGERVAFVLGQVGERLPGDGVR